MRQQILAPIFVLALLGGALFLLRKKGLAQFAAFPYRPARRIREIKSTRDVPMGYLAAG